MASLRAFRISRGDDPVGYLGEGGGPFVLASTSALGFPFLKQARITCLDALHEDDLAHLAQQAPDLDHLVAALVRAGFQVEPEAYERLFPALGDAPLGGPEADEELARPAQPTPSAKGARAPERSGER
jgi:hypothetical protein